MAYGIPLALTVHSLEPLRPWKREQLGGGYDVSSWVERTAIESAEAVIAVSRGTRDDVLRLFDVPEERVHVIHNGIDADFYRPDPATNFLEQRGIDPTVPYVLFVGRVTRQKGIVHLVRAIHHLAPGIGVVLCAGQPDTPEIAREMAAGVRAAQAERPNVVWIGEMVSREEVRQLYSHAAVFCCPSVYEPFGIINLEAAACETPVVASAVGGIPEVVVDGETGLLVPVELSPDDPMRPIDPDRFERNLAGAINALMADPRARAVMGRAARRRALEAVQLGLDRAPDHHALPQARRLNRGDRAPRWIEGEQLPAIGATGRTARRRATVAGTPSVDSVTEQPARAAAAAEPRPAPRDPSAHRSSPSPTCASATAASRPSTA